MPPKSSSAYRILVASADPTIRFAGRELARYLRRATGRSFSVRSGSAPTDADFLLGLPADLKNVRPRAHLGPQDDWILIRPVGKGVILSGSNPRSVLFAVYRYLRELGFAWIRPGKRGEVIPSLRRVVRNDIRISEAATSRLRHFCIEGATSFEHARDLIDWGAKHGMNGYFIQFRTGHVFFNRWHSHENNPHLPSRQISVKRAADITQRLMLEIKQRGLELGLMGHAWTCAVLGIESEGWATIEPKLSAQKKSWLASVKGKRGFHGGVPLNTNLCTSKPQVREAIADECVRFAQEHLEVDFPRFWLADGESNSCDCPSCRRKRPADWLVDILNLIDEKCTKAGLDTRFAFPVYADLLWPPAKSRVKNPDRFAIQFSPISRKYSVSLRAASQQRGRMAPYRLNDYSLPQKVADNLAYLRAWQRAFPGESYVFDYHLWCACYLDMAQVNLARILRDDIATYPQLGLSGLDNCGNQRMSFPHNLLLDTTAAMLWNRRRSFNSIAKESFAQAYGRDAVPAQEFFTKLSKLWSPFFDAVHAPSRDQKRITAGRRNVPRMEKLCTEFRPIIDRNLKRTQGAVKWSWRYAKKFVDWMDLLVPAYEAYLNATPDVDERFEAAFEFIRKRESTLHPALDVFAVIKAMKWRIHEALVDSQEEPNLYG